MVRLVLLLIVLFVALACDGAARQHDDGAQSVLLLTLDTTRLDALGTYGRSHARTPRLDALAGESRRFTQAVTTAPYTGPSHASMMTGLLPPQHGLRDFLDQALPDATTTLAEILRDAGYDTAAFVSAYVLDQRYGLDQGFDVYSSVDEPRGESNFSRRRSDETVDEAVAWLREREGEHGAEGRRPFLLWVHFFDPHFPYDIPRAFKTPSIGPLPPKKRQLVRARARYQDAIAYMDSEIGRLLDAIDAKGLLEGLVVVAVSDHGEILGEHGLSPGTHSPVLYDSTLRVPLLLRAPGRLEPSDEGRQVSVVDVFPTILALLGLPVPEGLAGRSLLERAALPRPAYSETFYERFPQRAAEGDELTSLRVEGWKLVSGPGRVELFDLLDDPGEVLDVAAANPSRVEQLQVLLAELRDGWPAEGAPSRELELSEGERDPHRERLRSLGYVE